MTTQSKSRWSRWRWPLRLGILAAFVWAVAVAALAIFQETLLFHPSQQNFAACHLLPRGGAATGRAVHTSGGVRLYDVVPAGIQPKAWFLHFHGNAGSACDRLVFLGPALKRRFPIRYAVAELPGFAFAGIPNDPTLRTLNRPSVDSWKDYGLKVFDELQTRSPMPVIVYGLSMGSGVATYLASQRPVAALMLEAPFESLRKAAQDLYPWAPVNVLLKQNFDNAEAAAHSQASFAVLLHGDRDRKISIDHSERLLTHFKIPAALIRIPGATHSTCESADPVRYWDAFESVVARVVGAGR